MAKLKSNIKIIGSLDGFVVYTLPGVEDPVVRRKSGPTKEQIMKDPKYDVLRRNLAELGGRSTATSFLMKAFQPLRHLADPNTSGQLNKLLKPLQQLDTVSEFGKRAVRLSAAPELLQGFNLTKATRFDNCVQASFGCVLSRESGEASLALPALVPRLNFFAPQGYTFCRLVMTLGVVPDLFYAVPKYAPQGDYKNCYAVGAYTDWFAAGNGAPSQTLSLSLPYTPPNEAFSLVLSVGMQVGIPGITGAIEPLRERVGSAKILAVA